MRRRLRRRYGRALHAKTTCKSIAQFPYVKCKSVLKGHARYGRMFGQDMVSYGGAQIRVTYTPGRAEGYEADILSGGRIVRRAAGATRVQAIGRAEKIIDGGLS